MKLTITKYNEYNEDDEVIQTYQAIVINHKKERQQALTTFKNYIKELKIQVNNCGKIKSILLFNNN